MNRIQTDGQFQYSDTPRYRMQDMRSFGWLVKKGPTHSDYDGHDAVFLRRSSEFSNDPVIQEQEKIYLKNIDIIRKKLKTTYVIRQIITALIGIFLILIGSLYFIRLEIDSLGNTTAAIDDGIQAIFEAFLPFKAASIVALVFRFVLIAVGIIVLLSMFSNKKKYLRSLEHPPKRYKKYVILINDSMKKGKIRVMQIKQGGLPACRPCSSCDGCDGCFSNETEMICQ